MKPVLAKENIHLNQSAATQEEAIRLAGKALVDAGYVTADYIEKMLEREGLTSTYMGNAIAIPHGTEDSKQDVLHSGISVIQLPEGVEYGDGNIAKVIFGIAGKMMSIWRFCLRLRLSAQKRTMSNGSSMRKMKTS